MACFILVADCLVHLKYISVEFLVIIDCFLDLQDLNQA